MKQYVIDSNILLDFPQIIEKEKNNTLIIPTDVLRELDGLKLNQNSEIAFKARRAAVVISHNIENLEWDDSFEKERIPVDDKVIAVAQKHSATLLTNDVYVKVKAKIRGISTKGYGNDNSYSGVVTTYLTMNDEELSCMVNEHRLPDNMMIQNENGDNEYLTLNENQYLIVKDLEQPCIKNGIPDYEVLSIFCYKDGELVPIALPHKLRIFNGWINSIGARNPEQSCLIDALNREENTIICAQGCFGTGKSYLLNNFAIQELEREKISKIVYVPNNAFTQNTLDIGALPGQVLEKVEGQIGPLIDLVGIDQVQRWMEEEKLEIVPMGFIRGRSFQNSIIIVNEAQNLTEDHIKLLIARCGEGSRIFFDGDYKQTDSAIFKNKNGLKLLLNLHNSPIYSRIFATINLKTIERSKTAQAAAYLDEISGNFD